MLNMSMPPPPRRAPPSPCGILLKSTKHQTIYATTSELDSKEMDAFDEHPALAEAKAEKDKRLSIPLASCFAKYTEREQLGQSELWYCGKCKTHRQVCVTKLGQMWSRCGGDVVEKAIYVGVILIFRGFTRNGGVSGVLNAMDTCMCSSPSWSISACGFTGVSVFELVAKLRVCASCAPMVLAGPTGFAGLSQRSK